jgi:hypothetical protein
LIIDDRVRGVLPLDKPLRVSAGSRLVRVEKEGFEPIAKAVEVKAGQENEARLSARSRKGRLQVVEKRGWPLTVELDGAAVGATPWEGLVDIGVHSVRLRGAVSAEDLASCGASEATSSGGEQAEQASMGSGPPTEVTVKLYERTAVSLEAKELDGALEIDATPKSARVSVDGQVVGRGAWRGRLPLGEHTVEVRAPDFLSVTRKVQVERRKQRELSVALEVDPAKARLDATRRVTGIAAWAGYGVGAVGLGLFAVTGGLAASTVSDIRSRCGGDHCPLTEQTNLDRARALATTSTTGLVIGALGVAAGTVTLVLNRSLGRGAAPSEVDPAPRSAGVVLRAGSGFGALEIGGRF